MEGSVPELDMQRHRPDLSAAEEVDRHTAMRIIRLAQSSVFFLSSSLSFVLSFFQRELNGRDREMVHVETWVEERENGTTKGRSASYADIVRQHPSPRTPPIKSSKAHQELSASDPSSDSESSSSSRSSLDHSHQMPQEAPGGKEEQRERNGHQKADQSVEDDEVDQSVRHRSSRSRGLGLGVQEQALEKEGVWEEPRRRR